MTVQVLPVPGLPLVRPGDDLPALLAGAVAAVGARPGDVVVVCQKVVSKAEGAVVRLDDVVPSPLAETAAAQTQAKDPRAVEVVLRQARRIVRMDRGHLIVETRHGWVCANAGVDESNGVADGVLTLLPEDADASAARLRAALVARLAVEPLAVVVTDTFGRPWRDGLVEVALGCAGMDPMLDLRGRADLHGRTLHHTVVALADEVAAAAGLVMEKDSGIAAAIVRGVRWTPGDRGAAEALVRRPEFDLFR